MESEPEGWKMFSDSPQNFREIIVQDNRGRSHPQLMSGAAANYLANMIYLVEEGPNEFVQLHARRQEGEGTAIKQFGAERFFQARDLAADRRLLDPVRHIANGGDDSAMTGDVIEKLEMMNVHDRVIRCSPANLSIHDCAAVGAS
jgi:hypothetical protein